MPHIGSGGGGHGYEAILQSAKGRLRASPPSRAATAAVNAWLDASVLPTRQKCNTVLERLAAFSFLESAKS